MLWSLVVVVVVMEVWRVLGLFPEAMMTVIIIGTYMIVVWLLLLARSGKVLRPVVRGLPRVLVVLRRRLLAVSGREAGPVGVFLRPGGGMGGAGREGSSSSGGGSLGSLSRGRGRS